MRHIQPSSPALSRAAQARIDPLKQANLLFASASVQKAFWVQTNRASRRRKPRLLADTLGEMMAGGLGQSIKHAGVIGNILQAVMPAELLPELQIGALHRGVLTLHTASGAGAYECERTYAPLLVEACREAAPSLRIERVRFQVGASSSRR